MIQNSARVTPGHWGTSSEVDSKKKKKKSIFFIILPHEVISQSKFF